MYLMYKSLSNILSIWIFHDFDILAKIVVIIVNESTLTKTMIYCSLLQLHVHVILRRDK